MSLEIVTFVVLLVLSIESRQANISHIIEKLRHLEGRVIIQSIPGHLNIPGHEPADKYAKEIVQNGKTTVIPLSYKTARSAIIKRELKDPPPRYPVVSKAYKDLLIKGEK